MKSQQLIKVPPRPRILISHLNYAEACKNEGIRNEFVSGIDVGEFREFARLQYCAKRSKEYLATKLDAGWDDNITMAALTQSIYSSPFKIAIFPLAFKLANGRIRRPDQFISMLEHELFHCWDASENGSNYYDPTKTKDQRYAASELRAIEYQESMLSGKNVGRHFLRDLRLVRGDFGKLLEDEK
jgi:hypothetical protein